MTTKKNEYKRGRIDNVQKSYKANKTNVFFIPNEINVQYIKEMSA